MGGGAIDQRKRPAGYFGATVLGLSIVVPLFILGGLAAWALATQASHPSGFRSLERDLAAQPGVTVVGSWRHDDMVLEDCGFTLQVRACPPVRVDFYDGHVWGGLFDRIDGVAICTADGSAKLLPVARLAEVGLLVGNLPDLLARLEGVLAAAEGMAANGSWPGPGGGWVVLRYPLGNGLR